MHIKAKTVLENNGVISADGQLYSEAFALWTPTLVSTGAGGSVSYIICSIIELLILFSIFK